MGQVRAILHQHLWELGRRAGPRPDAEDPNTLVPSENLMQALAELAPSARREAGQDYARLWAKTFPTLVRQVRGEPERMLAIFTDEVLPFLTGTRVVARAQRLAPHRFRIVMEQPLDDEYLAGLATGFMALTGATVNATPTSSHLDLHIQVKSRDRAVRWMRHVSQLRLPLLLTSALAAAVGIATVHATADPSIISILAVLIGTVAAQSGANALHDLRHPRRMHLRPVSPSVGWLWFQFIGSFALAGTALAWLALDHPGTVAFAAIGVATASQYARFRDAGLGPVLAAFTHGPLIVWGAAFAVSGQLPESNLAGLLVTLPPALLAAAMMQLDDIADRPLHEAAGRRTLVVRSTPQRSLMTFHALTLLGTATASLWSWGQPRMLLLGGLLLLLAGAIAMQVQRSDDPHDLSNSRLLMAALYATTALHLVVSIL